jgi:hypothetical protein
MIFRALDNVCHFKKCEMDRYQPREKRYQETLSKSSRYRYQEYQKIIIRKS